MPLCPLPDVLPVPEPGPRPSRLRFFVEPGAGDSLCSPIFSTAGAFSDFATMSFLYGRHLDEVPHLLELPAERGRILLDHHVLVVLEPDRLEREPLAPRLADPALHLLDLQLPGARRLILRRRFRAALRMPYECARHQTASLLCARDR